MDRRPVSSDPVGGRIGSRPEARTCNDLGRKAQEKIMAIPARLVRIADVMEQKTKPKSFAFDVIFNREFAME